MNKSMLREMIGEAKSAAKQAVADTRRMLGRTSDPDLAIYQKLSQADFEALSQEHGPAAVTEYIQTMEARRLQGGNNGTVQG
jgi:hypothetical protein